MLLFQIHETSKIFRFNDKGIMRQKLSFTKKIMNYGECCGPKLLREKELFALKKLF